MMLTDFLPTTKKECQLRGWDELDVILFSGDAYVDHPSFGAAVIGRTLEAHGYKVAIVPQPDWHGAYCGDVDVTGWRKPISHYREMLWNGKEDDMYLCVREPDGYHGQIKTTGWAVYPTWESWEWPGWEGEPTIVEVYTKAPEVKLYLNDRLVGTKQVDRSTQFKAVFEVPYEPGTLRAEASGQTRILSTPGKPYAIRLSPEPESINAMDVAFVVIEVGGCIVTTCSVVSDLVYRDTPNIIVIF